MNFFIYYTDDDGDRDRIGKASSLGEAVERAFDYIIDNHSRYGDSDEEIKKSLFERMYYIIGYGPESVEIEEQ